jgi:hypothetical protein
MATPAKPQQGIQKANCQIAASGSLLLLMASIVSLDGELHKGVVNQQIQPQHNSCVSVFSTPLVCNSGLPQNQPLMSMRKLCCLTSSSSPLINLLYRTIVLLRQRLL